MPEIRNWETDQIIIENKNLSLKELIEVAVKKGANLEMADLAGANLAGAHLEMANLAGANLAGAHLEGAHLEWAYLAGANLAGAKIDYKIQEGLLQQVTDIVLKDNDKLDISSWHDSCGTTHCLAGWACFLSDAAKELEKNHGTEIAGLLTLGAEAHSYFFKDNKTTLEWLKKCQK